MQYIVADGLHGSDANTTTYKHKHLVTITVDVKTRSSVRPIQVNFDLSCLVHIVIESLGPVTQNSNM